MEVEAEWSALVAPYSSAAERLGFAFVERQIKTGIPPSPDTTFLCTDFQFDGHATFLDLGGTLARGAHHRGLLIGFNGVQLYTFVRTPAITLVLTNGESPDAVKRLNSGCNRLVASVMKKLTRDKDLGLVRMRGAEDLALVVDRHRERVRKRGGEPIEVTGPPLEFRWQLSEQWERSEAPW